MLVATFATFVLTLRAEEAPLPAGVRREATSFPPKLASGAEALLARFKLVTPPYAKSPLLPMAFARRLQPEWSSGQWHENPAVMPGSRVELNLPERILEDFRRELPQKREWKVIDAYIIFYEEAGVVHLVACDEAGSVTRFRTVRPKNPHELELADFRSE